MESMDDWMITREDTPTLYRLMEEGINFTQFYTPGYGTARTINSEFCVNTGIFLPTTGEYVFDYVTNDFSQSIASQAVANGYTAEVFHYNKPDFYSRGVFEPAMGYNAYNCYADYEKDKNRLYDDSLLFDVPALNQLFFREGRTLNTIITRSAYLSYVYNEVLSHYALKQYPQYRGKYGSQEEDCARVKAKLVDDMFARLLEELDQLGLRNDTVIIGVTDHYTYGYKDEASLLELSGVGEKLLLEKTPCFIWSPDLEPMTVEKTLNTSDFVPTVLNLLGVETGYRYMGRDAFDETYPGRVLFSNGSWITAEAVYDAGKKKYMTPGGAEQLVSETFALEMKQQLQAFVRTNNLILETDYYGQ
jgi:phosphoglycerol transferase MdoB-like AlkP superfamily enzyme